MLAPRELGQQPPRSLIILIFILARILPHIAVLDLRAPSAASAMCIGMSTMPIGDNNCLGRRPRFVPRLPPGRLVGVVGILQGRRGGGERGGQRHAHALAALWRACAYSGRRVRRVGEVATALRVLLGRYGRGGRGSGGFFFFFVEGFMRGFVG